MNKKMISLIVSLVAGIIALTIIFTRIDIKEIFETFSNATPLLVGAYMLVVLLMMMTLTWRWQVIISSQGHKHVSGWHLFWYKVIGMGVSYVTPTAKVGGEPVRAGLLSRHEIPFNKALSTVVIDKTIELTSSGFFFVIGAVVILFSYALPENTKWLLIVIALAFLLMIMYFYRQMLRGEDFFGKLFRILRIHKRKKGKKWEKQLKTFERLIINFYHKDKKHFTYSLLISLLSWVIMIVEYKLVLMILGVEQATIIQIFLIFSFIGAAYLVPIPMGLGSLEASQVSVFALTGMRQSAGVALALLVRTKDLLWTAIGFVALSIYGLRFKDTVENTTNIVEEVEKYTEEE